MMGSNPTTFGSAEKGMRGVFLWPIALPPPPFFFFACLLVYCQRVPSGSVMYEDTPLP